jgi:hypothetical protein
MFVLRQRNTTVLFWTNIVLDQNKITEIGSVNSSISN